MNKVKKRCFGDVIAKKLHITLRYPKRLMSKMDLLTRVNSSCKRSTQRITPLCYIHAGNKVYPIYTAAQI